MKKTLGLLTSALFVLAMTAMPAQAQYESSMMNEGSHLYAGLQGGVSSAQLSEDFGNNNTTLSSSDRRVGLTGGLVAEYRFDPEGIWGIRSGLRYTQRGAESTDSGVTSTLELDYIEAPVLLLARTPNNNSTLVGRIYGGAVPAVEVNCGITVEGNGQSASGSCDDAGLGDQIDNFDILSRLGGGVGLNIGPGQFTVDARYDYGLLNLTGDDSALVETHNEGFAVTAGYLLAL